MNALGQNAQLCRFMEELYSSRHDRGAVTAYLRRCNAPPVSAPQRVVSFSDPVTLPKATAYFSLSFCS